MIIVLLTAFNGVIEEPKLGKAFEEALPFTALLVVFFTGSVYSAEVGYIDMQLMLRNLDSIKKFTKDLLNKFSISEVINAIKTQNKKIISSVPGIGQKMSDRLILELKSKLKNEIRIEEEDKDKVDFMNSEIKKMLEECYTLKELYLRWNLISSIGGKLVLGFGQKY